MKAPASTTLPRALLPVAALLLSLAHSEEVQSHGLLFERWLRDTFFDGYQPESYTQKWDIPAEANRHHGHLPVNPKAIKYGTPIGLGDATRQFQINEPFLLILAFWQQANAAEKRWVNAQAIRIEPDQWKKLWHPITQSDLDRLNSVIKDGSLSLDEARVRAKAIKSAPPFTESVIQVNPKIDASQRRLQCSLRFVDVFENLATEADPAPQTNPTLFEVPLPGPLPSPPREFKAR